MLTNTDTRDETPNVEHFDDDASRLNDSTDDEDAACHQYRTAPAERVGERGEEGANKAASCEECNNRARTSVGILL